MQEEELEAVDIEEISNVGREMKDHPKIGESTSFLVLLKEMDPLWTGFRRAAVRTDGAMGRV